MEALEETQELVPAERIERTILVLRGEKVILDSDISRLYGVETKVLVQAMKRNLDRFPPDFMFHLTPEEVEILRCQIGTSSWGGRRYLPYAFTEQGVAMLSSVLHSPRAIRVNIEIMRAFAKQCEIFVHRHMTLLESTGDVNYEALPRRSSPRETSARRRRSSRGCSSAC